MSSTPQKPTPAKMCKSPKNAAFQISKPDKVQIINEYENLNTNCTVIGSNNLHLVKKPQVVTGMSPAYSNPSPGYPQSPYSSPASLKSPSPQSFKPPTPQPSFPVMQIIHSSHQLLARPIQATQPQQNVIKLKPHLNILPKPSASPQPSPKPSVSPHIVIPSQQTATIMPTAQPLLLNQMPMLAPGVQLILRPQTAKIPAHMQAAAPQGLILQPSGQQLLQIQSPRTAQPMVRVLTNGVQLAPQAQVVSQVTSPVITHTTTQQAQIMQNEQNLTLTTTTQQHACNSPPKKKPKKKKQKLDLANIMKLSGIGDEDDIQFESDTSQSESEPNNTIQLHPGDIPQAQHNLIQEANIIRSQSNVIQATDAGKRIGNIQISTVAQPTTVSTATPLVQLLNQNFQSGVSSTSFQSSQTTAPAGIPLNSFIAPNITINNGLVVQRNGGFKLALGEDGRLVLQHDPTLNQDLQSQLLLQSIFGLNGLVLQPSMDQQVHSQTVQTIQQQSVQTIQQQTVQSQTIQTVQQQTVQPHALQTIQQAIQPQIQAVQPQTVQQTVQQTIQHQTVQSQPLHAHTQPMQIVQPQPIHTIHQSHNIQQHTIQSQPVQSIQAPTVQAIQSQVHQSIQSQIQSLLQPQPLQAIAPQAPVHSQPQSSHVTSTIQTHQTTVPSQPVLKVQPFQKTPPVQTVHPQPVQTIHHQPSQQQNLENQQNHPPQTSYVVNLTPDQLEQLKRNGQLTVNGQTIFMQRPNMVKSEHNENKVKLSPKIKPVKKVNKIPANAMKNASHDNMKVINHTSDKVLNHVAKETKSSLVSALQAPPKIIAPHNQVQVQPQQKAPSQPSAVVQPSVTVQPTMQSTVSSQTQTTKPPIQARMQGTQTTQNHSAQTDTNNGTNNNQEVDHLLGQLLEEPPNVQAPNATSTNQNQPPQRIHTIQLTPQQQQHLKSIQLQIQTLSARLVPGDTEMHAALKMLFAEQQKILASGKLLPPDKVIYQNNQLTIINPSSLGIGGGGVNKTEAQIIQAPVLPRSTTNETSNNHQVAAVQTQTVPKITVTVPASASEHANHVPGTNAGKAPSSAVQQASVASHVHQNKYIPSFTKAQLLEQQLNTDQNGAMKPDIHTPFRDKADACKRLIRYHCYNQPVLSEKDLNKADEIFELTARHFIDKFSRMVDKYRYLLLKESMRQVQTSELMMLDRMFLAEEQQSLMKLRQELQEGPPPDLLTQLSSSSSTSQQPSSSAPISSEHQQEEYDEWACIQRELGCLQQPNDNKPHHNNVIVNQQQAGPGQPSSGSVPKIVANHQGQAHHHHHHQVSAVPPPTVTTSVPAFHSPPKRSASSDSRLETLKKFRVEKHSKKHGEVQNNIVNNSCGGVPGGMCGGGAIGHKTQGQNVHLQQRGVQQQPQFSVHNSQQSSVQTVRHVQSTNIQQQQFTATTQQRTMHYSATHQQSTQQGSYSTNITHQQHYTQHNMQFMDVAQNFHALCGSQQIGGQQHGAPQLHATNNSASSVNNSVHNNNNNNSKNNIQSSHGSQSSESESGGNNSIDEHVQSAIDSILNLQQNSNLDLDEAVSSILS